MVGTGSFVLPGLAAAAPGQKSLKNNSDLPVPEEEVMYADEMQSFSPSAKQVPVDQLPISVYSNESSLESGMSAMASANRCYGTGVKFLDVQVCLNSNGNIKA
ncbi:hypothetical protein, partial [Haladaptatus sp. R4]|uniref:hypothetical protein n=1 Tax=Haladaptatus sp. R4 TaxID=1679489 RepID=UPI001CC01310